MADEHPATHLTLRLQTGHAADGYRFEVAFGEASAPLVVDEPPPLGEGAGPNASALLAAAVGNCLSASLLFCLRRARIAVHDLSTEVSATHARNAEGRLRIDAIDVVLRPTVEAGAGGRYARCVEIFEDYCVVTASVRRGIDVSVRVEPAFVESTAGTPTAEH